VELNNEFRVAVPVAKTWEVLTDVERVAPCLPGAEITEAGEDGTYRGTFSVRLGPTTAAYRGELSMEEVDAEAHRAVMRASGQDKRGQGSAKATIVSSLRAEGDATTVAVETDFTITGRLARFGRGGMIEDVSNRLLRDFSECLQKTIEGAGATPPAAAEPGGGEPGSGTPVAASPTAAGPSPAAPPAPRAKPVGGFSLLLRALVDRIRRAFRRRR
jgi:carbon monoxide dehydrogenase subunit G